MEVLRKMDWIKAILEKHRKEDGTIDLAAAIQEITAEFPKNAVPKSTFNDTNEQLKTAKGTIETLKKSNGDNETLQKTIKDHEATIAGLQKAASDKDKEFKIKAALEKEGALDADYLIFKAGGLDKFEMDKEGAIKDLENLIKQSKENNPTFFKAAEDPNKGSGGNLKPVERKLPGGGAGDPEPQDLSSAIAAQYGFQK
jgi:hypothetical protein